MTNVRKIGANHVHPPYKYRTAIYATSKSHMPQNYFLLYHKRQN